MDFCKHLYSTRKRRPVDLRRPDRQMGARASYPGRAEVPAACLPDRKWRLAGVEGIEGEGVTYCLKPVPVISSSGFPLTCNFLSSPISDIS